MLRLRNGPDPRVIAAIALLVAGLVGQARA